MSKRKDADKSPLLRLPRQGPRLTAAEIVVQLNPARQLSSSIRLPQHVLTYHFGAGTTRGAVNSDKMTNYRNRPGIYEPSDPGGQDADAKQGRLRLDWGKAWLKSLQVMTGMAPVSNYNRQLTQAILWDRMPYLGKALNVEVIALDAAPQGYADFDRGSPKKFVIDPHGILAA